MEKVHIDDIEPRLDSATVKRPLTDGLAATNVTINQYELAPGDSFAFGYHMHDQQEEVFLIQRGEVTFETEEGDVHAAAGDALRFAPGEFQQGFNTGTERVIAFAIGAPQETGKSEVLRECANCDDRTPQTIERVDDGAAIITRCLECDSETARFD